VRPVAVVVVEEGAQHPLEVTPIHDQEPVEALDAGGTDEASAIAFAFLRSRSARPMHRACAV
jgi:hypothetical protein